MLVGLLFIITMASSYSVPTISYKCNSHIDVGLFSVIKCRDSQTGFYVQKHESCCYSLEPVKFDIGSISNTARFLMVLDQHHSTGYCSIHECLVTRDNVDGYSITTFIHPYAITNTTIVPHAILSTLLN